MRTQQGGPGLQLSLWWVPKRKVAFTRRQQMMLFKENIFEIGPIGADWNLPQFEIHSSRGEYTWIFMGYGFGTYSQ